MAARVDAVPLLPSGPISTRAYRPIPEGKAKVAVTTTGEEKISKPRLVSPRDPLRPER